MIRVTGRCRAGKEDSVQAPEMQELLLTGSSPADCSGLGFLRKGNPWEGQVTGRLPSVIFSGYFSFKRWDQPFKEKMSCSVVLAAWRDRRAEPKKLIITGNYYCKEPHKSV